MDSVQSRVQFQGESSQWWSNGGYHQKHEWDEGTKSLTSQKIPDKLWLTCFNPDLMPNTKRCYSRAQRTKTRLLACNQCLDKPMLQRRCPWGCRQLKHSSRKRDSWSTANFAKCKKTNWCLSKTVLAMKHIIAVKNTRRNTGRVGTSRSAHGTTRGKENAQRKGIGGGFSCHISLARSGNTSRTMKNLNTHLIST